MAVGIHGSDYFGKVDEVLGVFHVMTKFDHINYFPLIPLHSYLVVRGGDDAARDIGAPRYIRIGLSGKSLFLAWGRAFALATVFVALAAMFMTRELSPDPSHWKISLGVALGAGATFAASYYPFHGLGRASFGRAMGLGRTAGLGEEELARVARAFGEAVPRPFEVAPPPARRSEPGPGEPPPPASR